MKLALLGCDEEALDLVRCAVLECGHSLTAAYDLGKWQEDVRRLAPWVTLAESWEALLLGGVEAVIVARGQFDDSRQSGVSANTRRCDQLRKLVQAGVPLLVCHPACESIIGLELEMIRRDTGGVIFPFLPGCEHPAISALQKLLAAPAEEGLGAIEQIVLERCLVDRSRPAVLAQFARDAAILQTLLGSIKKLSASGPVGEAGRDPLGPKTKSLPSLANLNVHLSGERDFPARWTVEPAEGQADGRLLISGTAGKATLRMPAGSRPWSLELAGPRQQSITYDGWSEPNQALYQLATAITARSAQTISWLAACRAQEIAESIDRSLERGRAVDFFGEQPTEEGAFKGLMAIGGCLMLAMMLAGVLAAAAVELLDLPFRNFALWRSGWPVCILAPVLFFLLLQGLQLVIRRDGAPSQDAASPESAAKPPK